MPHPSEAERARRTRRTIIDIARRRQRPGTGSRIEILETPLRIWPDLREVLRGIPWAVAGGVATRRYMPERGTQDLDIVILEHDAARVDERLKARGFEFLSALSIGGGAWRAPDHTPVDVIEANGPWWPAALAEAAASPDQQGLPTLPLPYLVLMKMLSSRAQDTADVVRIMGLASPGDRQRTADTVAEHAPDLSDDLASLIELGKLEFEDV
jgi:hypothetical protein